MKNTLPKLLQDALNDNSIDIKVITEVLKVPWLKLNLKFPTLTENQLNELTNDSNWQKVGEIKYGKSSKYIIGELNNQTRIWTVASFTGAQRSASPLLFGPQPFDKFLNMSLKHEQFHDKIDFDSKCKFFRKEYDYGWYIEDTSIIKEWVSELVPDEDINLINTYVLPPGGYLFPHMDYSFDNVGLAKIYIGAVVKPGNVVGVLGCGNIPITEGDVFLFNNYSLPHWVYNGSDSIRVVIDLAANLNSPNIKQLIENSFTNTFLK